MASSNRITRGHGFVDSTAQYLAPAPHSVGKKDEFAGAVDPEPGLYLLAGLVHVEGGQNSFSSWFCF